MVHWPDTHPTPVIKLMNFESAMTFLDDDNRLKAQAADMQACARVMAFVIQQFIEVGALSDNKPESKVETAAAQPPQVNNQNAEAPVELRKASQPTAAAPASDPMDLSSLSNPGPLQQTAERKVLVREATNVAVAQKLGIDVAKLSVMFPAYHAGLLNLLADMVEKSLEAGEALRRLEEKK